MVMYYDVLLLRCAWKPGGSSLAPYFEVILDTSSSLAPFQAPASCRKQKKKHHLEQTKAQ